MNKEIENKHGNHQDNNEKRFDDEINHLPDNKINNLDNPNNPNNSDKPNKPNTPSKPNYKKIIFGILVLVLIIWVIFFIIDKVYDNNDDLSIFNYKNYSFAKLDNGLWGVSVAKSIEGEDFLMVFHHTPMELEHIEIGGSFKDFFPSNETYITFDPLVWDKSPNLKFTLFDLSLKLAGTSSLIQGNIPFNPQISCYINNSEVCEDIGVFQCGEKNVIQFIEDDYSYIYAENSCITLRSPKDSFSKVSNRLIYTLIGVMEG